MFQRIFISYRNVILLAFVAIPIGIAVGALDAIFGEVLLLLTEIRMEYAYCLIPFLGLIGAMIVWVNQKYGGISRKGMSLIFEAGHGMAKDIPLRLIPLTVIGTWLTHLFGGSAGREGVSIQLGGTLAHGIGKGLPIANSSKILLITGMAAGFSGLFGTPIGATFFAIEVLTVGTIEHEAIIPALVSSFTASFTSSCLGLERFSFMLTDQISLSGLLAIKLLIIGVIFGVAGGLFSASLHKLKELFARKLKNPILRILMIGITISALSLLCWGGRYSGLGTNLIAASFGGDSFAWDFAMKFIFTVVTLSAGFQGGEVTPLFAIGSTLGVALATLLGIPSAFAAALGYAALFGSATNTLIAPILLGSEVFGYTYMPYFAVVCSLAYVCNGNFFIYPQQKGIWSSEI